MTGYVAVTLHRTNTASLGRTPGTNRVLSVIHTTIKNNNKGLSGMEEKELRAKVPICKRRKLTHCLQVSLA